MNTIASTEPENIWDDTINHELSVLYIDKGVAWLEVTEGPDKGCSMDIPSEFVDRDRQFTLDKKCDKIVLVQPKKHDSIMITAMKDMQVLSVIAEKTGRGFQITNVSIFRVKQQH